MPGDLQQIPPGAFHDAVHSAADIVRRPVVGGAASEALVLLLCAVKDARRFARLFGVEPARTAIQELRCLQDVAEQPQGMFGGDHLGEFEDHGALAGDRAGGAG